MGNFQESLFQEEVLLSQEKFALHAKFNAFTYC
jgi:hypothetical protein